MANSIEMSVNYKNKSESLSDDWKKCCRICHSEKGRLLTMCSCKGSLAFVHEKCQMQWLQVKKSIKCEICDTEMNVKRVHKDFFDWIVLRRNTFRLYLYLDIICGLQVVPLFLWTFCTTVSGVLISESLFVSILLYISILVLFVIILLWSFVCFLDHYMAYKQWAYNQFKYVLKKTKVKAETNSGDNGLDGDNSQTSRWRSLFRCFNCSNRKDANPQQIYQI